MRSSGSKQFRAAFVFLLVAMVTVPAMPLGPVSTAQGAAGDFSGFTAIDITSIKLWWTDDRPARESMFAKSDAMRSDSERIHLEVTGTLGFDCDTACLPSTSVPTAFPVATFDAEKGDQRANPTTHWATCIRATVTDVTLATKTAKWGFNVSITFPSGINTGPGSTDWAQTFHRLKVIPNAAETGPGYHTKNDCTASVQPTTSPAGGGTFHADTWYYFVAIDKFVNIETKYVSWCPGSHRWSTTCYNATTTAGATNPLTEANKQVDEAAVTPGVPEYRDLPFGRLHYLRMGGPANTQEDWGKEGPTHMRARFVSATDSSWIGPLYNPNRCQSNGDDPNSPRGPHQTGVSTDLCAGGAITGRVYDQFNVRWTVRDAVTNAIINKTSSSDGWQWRNAVPLNKLDPTVTDHTNDIKGVHFQNDLGDMSLKFLKNPLEMKVEANYDKFILELPGKQFSSTSDNVKVHGNGKTPIKVADLHVKYDTFDNVVRYTNKRATVDIPIVVRNIGTVKAWNESGLAAQDTEYNVGDANQIQASLLLNEMTTEVAQANDASRKLNVAKSVLPWIESPASGQSDNSLTRTFTLHLTSDPTLGGTGVSSATDPRKWILLNPGTYKLFTYVDPPDDTNNDLRAVEPATGGCAGARDNWTLCKREGEIRERTSANNWNVTTITIYDGVGPALQASKWSLNNRTTGSTFKLNETVYVQLNVTSSLNPSSVVLHAIPKNAPTPSQKEWPRGTQNFTMTKLTGSQATTCTDPNNPTAQLHCYVLKMDKLGMWNKSWEVGSPAVWEKTDWTLNVTVTDSSGAYNLPASSTNFYQAKTQSWPIQSKAITSTVTSPKPHLASTFALDDKKVNVTLWANATEIGFPDSAAAINRSFKISRPNVEAPTVAVTWWCRVGEQDSQVAGPNPTPPCAGTLFAKYQWEVSKTPPGWYFGNVTVKDKGGEVKTIPVSWFIPDNRPVIVKINKDAEVTAPANAKVEVEAKDDNGISKVYAQFTHKSASATNNFKCNFTLVRTSGTDQEGKWALDVPTGVSNDRGVLAPTGVESTCDGGSAPGAKRLVYAGDYRVRVSLNDLSVPSKWAAQEFDFTLKDEDAPTITLWGVNADPPEVEKNSPITFTVVAKDATLVTSARVVVTGTGAPSNPIALETRTFRDLDKAWEFKQEYRFQTPGTYTYFVEVFDSKGNKLSTQQAAKQLVVREFAGPRFDLVEPTIPNSGNTYRVAGPAPLIKVLAYDPQGVDKSTFEITVTGVTGVLTCATAGVVCDDQPNGRDVIMAYTLASGQTHGASITVTATAKDKDTPARTSDPWTKLVRVDAKGAKATLLDNFGLRHRASANDIWNVSAGATFNLTAADNSDEPFAGVKELRWSIDGTEESQGGDRAQVVLTDAYSTGLHTLQYWAVDRVGNAGEKGTLLFYLDDEAPMPNPAVPPPTGLYVNASFIDHSGVSRAVVRWRLNENNWETLPMTLRDGMWRATIPFSGARSDIVSYYILVWDRMNNQLSYGDESVPLARFSPANTAPTIRITAPSDDATVSGAVTLRWRASDPDGDALTFVIAVRGPNDSQFSEVRRITDGKATYTLDTSAYPDGVYEIRVTATDGQYFPTSTISVVVANSGTPGSPVSPLEPSDERVAPGKGVVLRAKVTRPATKVEAWIYMGNELKTKIGMRDDGVAPDQKASDGVYTAEVVAYDAGKYSARIHVEYQQDGETRTIETDPEAISFTVGSTPVDVIASNAILWSAVAILSVAAIGVGAFALTRGRRGGGGF